MAEHCWFKITTNLRKTRLTTALKKFQAECILAWGKQDWQAVSSGSDQELVMRERVVWFTGLKFKSIHLLLFQPNSSLWEWFGRCHCIKKWLSPAWSSLISECSAICICSPIARLSEMNKLCKHLLFTSVFLFNSYFRYI